MTRTFTVRVFRNSTTLELLVLLVATRVTALDDSSRGRHTEEGAGLSCCVFWETVGFVHLREKTVQAPTTATKNKPDKSIEERVTGAP